MPLNKSDQRLAAGNLRCSRSVAVLGHSNSLHEIGPRSSHQLRLRTLLCPRTGTLRGKKSEAVFTASHDSNSDPTHRTVVIPAPRGNTGGASARCRLANPRFRIRVKT